MFIGGLNSAVHRSFAERHLEGKRAQDVDITVLQLARAVQKHQQRLLETESAERQAQVYAGITPSSSYNLATSSGLQSFNRPTQKSAAAEVVRMRRSDPKTHQEIEAMSAPKQELYRAAFNLAESEPKHPSALCTDCKATARVHLNSECRQKQQTAKQPSLAAVGMAAKMEGGAAAIAADAAANAGSSTEAKFNALVAKVHQQQQQLNYTQSTMSALAAIGGSGQLRPGQFTGSSNAPRGAPLQRLPCNLCGYELGHHGSCYCDDPSQAPVDWKGPSRHTLEAGVGRYMQRCMSLNITSRLERCLATAAKLMREGKAPVQCRPFIDSLQQQQQQQPRHPGVHHAAAVQYGAAYMPYAYSMGLPAAGMQYFPALMQPAPLPLPAPAACTSCQHGRRHCCCCTPGRVPTYGQGADNSFRNPFGNSFAMLAILPNLQEEEADPVAAVITRSTNPAAQITLPMKRAADGSWTDKRFCWDGRKVNANSEVD
jgi:hypothetical protein